jgi:hypothetical protein
MARIFLVEDNEPFREAAAGCPKLEDHIVETSLPAARPSSAPS